MALGLAKKLLAPKAHLPNRTKHTLRNVVLGSGGHEMGRTRITSNDSIMNRARNWNVEHDPSVFFFIYIIIMTRAISHQPSLRTFGFWLEVIQF